jgi:hypothetical protein
MAEEITIAEAHRRMRAQGVSAREHVAFICPICATAQSIASLLRAGAPLDRVENYIGFSCEGRFTGAGPWPNDPAAQRARTKRGCDWTLGGLLRLHRLEVVTEDGDRQPSFEIASADIAQALEREMADG